MNIDILNILFRGNELDFFKIGFKNKKKYKNKISKYCITNSESDYDSDTGNKIFYHFQNIIYLLNFNLYILKTEEINSIRRIIIMDNKFIDIDTVKKYFMLNKYINYKNYNNYNLIEYNISKIKKCKYIREKRLNENIYNNNWNKLNFLYKFVEIKYIYINKNIYLKKIKKYRYYEDYYNIKTNISSYKLFIFGER